MAANKRRKRSGVSTVTIILALIASILAGTASVVLMAYFILPDVNKIKVKKMAGACSENREAIREALEVYAADNGGRYPDKLEDLTPHYLNTIPACPLEGNDTYSTGYHKNKGSGKGSVPDESYTLECIVESHKN